MTLLDVNFLLSDLLFFLLEFSQELIALLLKDLVLGLGVKVVNLNTRDFVSDVFNLDFLL